ncbi:unnamed protein product, partial [Cutaneotrichosporon oleaginosum]
VYSPDFLTRLVTALAIALAIAESPSPPSPTTCHFFSIPTPFPLLFRLSSHTSLRPRASHKGLTGKELDNVINDLNSKDQYNGTLHQFIKDTLKNCSTCSLKAKVVGGGDNNRPLPELNSGGCATNENESRL